MEKSFLTTLSCPFCGFPLEKDFTLEESKENIEFGLVRCKCGIYPVIEGILILLKNQSTSIRAIQKEDKKEALSSALKNHPQIEFFQKVIKLFPFFPKNKIIKLYKNIQVKSLKSFSSALKHLFYQGERKYFQNRYAYPDTTPFYPLFSLFSQTKSWVLDLGSGAGHFSFILSRYVPAEKIISFDLSFNALLFAKKFFLPTSNFICADANYPFPFKDQFLSGIFSIDTFNYLLSKKFLTREFRRILSNSGVLLLLHLHNALCLKGKISDVLSPAGYRELFTNLSPLKILPEEKIINDFFTEAQINLTEDEQFLKKTRGVAILKGKIPEIIDLNSFWLDFIPRIKENLSFHPWYEIKEEKNHYYLVLRTNLLQAHSKNIPEFTKYFPGEEKVEKSLLEGAESLLLGNLMKKLLLIPTSPFTSRKFSLGSKEENLSR